MEISVYGLGRFGFFWSELLSETFSVKAYSRSSDPLTPKGVERVAFDDLFDCDVLFLCTAISSMDEVLKQIAPKLKKNTLVIDTCSVKVYPMELMEKYLPENIYFMGSHPMFGPDSGKNGVEGLPIVLCKSRIKDEDFVKWKDHFRAMGMDVRSMDAHEHDKEAAYSQGITHFIGRTLNELALQDSQIGTKGYNSLLNIIKQTCNDPWQLFIDLQKYNPYTSDMREELEKALSLMLKKFNLIDSIDNSGEFNG